MTRYGMASGVVDARRPVPPPTPCPRHPGRALTGGPVVYTCPLGHRVQAADLEEAHR